MMSLVFAWYWLDTMSPVHGPSLETGRVPFQRNTWRNVPGSPPNEKLPGDGSSGPFHDTRRSPARVLYMTRIFMPGRNESLGTPPSASDKTRLEELVSDSVGADELLFVTGVPRSATHTTVRRGMSLYHMPRYIFSGVEFEGEKKPKAKAPPSETTVAPGESGLPGTSRSSDAHGGARRMRTLVMQAKASDRSIKTFFLEIQM
jgi:hypothetical protein